MASVTCMGRIFFSYVYLTFSLSFLLFKFTVYCESCIASPAEEQLRCQDCQSLHPGGFPKVCLLLENLLLELFSKEYASRKDAVQLKETQFKHERTATCMLCLSLQSVH